MTTSTSDPAALKADLGDRLRAEGFAVVGVTTPDAIPDVPARLGAFLDGGYNGDMDWLADRADWRAAPSVLWPEVRSIVMAGFNYGPDHDPLDDLGRTDRGVISVYARNRDYHDVIKKKLKRVARWLAEAHSAKVKVFVDTAPVAEKPLAEAAGLGWQGKHTNMVSTDHGSWLFLGSIFTDADLPPDAGEADHCGSCRNCLDVCPTDAFPAPYRLDARRCISYLTIEHKGHIAEEMRAAMGNRIYGCDDCLAVCPWNKFASEAREAKLQARDDLNAPALADLARLDDASFRALFSGSPIKRTGRDRFVRNVLIAIGNSGDADYADIIENLLWDDSPLVRAMAVWALKRVAPPARVSSLSASFRPQEADPQVCEEWDRPSPLRDPVPPSGTG